MSKKYNNLAYFGGAESYRGKISKKIIPFYF